ncbi:tRNA dihydrouridine(20/20a) synthase DusA [Echinimonas agarilytica]|uniref:tRNA-dihydrouridine(20/20a) synthase n=2 Tax=Echinimonas agarilytica TaxID=1215918 RepID=A0AA41W4J1_9GAMM|nr:tRNA dihydrouridine(20/20a) synthase DusA [Echinimonas agarilytica]MCM2678720.1 tRNA dihydrouridine(20/20a) synthase DusA [Echinimonas agarilytica]
MSLSRRLSIAPMLDWTDRHCRYFHRQLSQHALLYTEMVTTGAILFGKGDYLQFNELEQPVAVQLGGSDPVDLAKCAKIAAERGYSEINLNVGCPSDRVQKGRFGACLMEEPKLVAECVDAMKQVADIPVTVKHRIGIDEHESYAFMTDFVGEVNQAGCDVFIVHARKAWLQGLSPKQNREVPPLDYERVYQLKKDFNHCHISINGGVMTLAQALEHLEHVDGVMMGRAAYQNPYLLAEADALIFGQETERRSRADIVQAMLPYMEAQISEGARLNSIIRHMLGLYQAVPGARAWRRYLSENARGEGKTIQVVEQAMALVYD